jgi:hypothetical protein
MGFDGLIVRRGAAKATLCLAPSGAVHNLQVNTLLEVFFILWFVVRERVGGVIEVTVVQPVGSQQEGDRRGEKGTNTCEYGLVFCTHTHTHTQHTHRRSFWHVV